MSRKRSFNARQEGFTIAELSITILVMTILLVAGAPLINRLLDQNRVMLSAQSLAAQLQYARMKAVSSNEPFQVNFPAGERTYRLENSGGEVIAGPFWLPTGINWNNQDAGNEITFPGRYVTFQPSGNVNPSGNGSAGRVKIINIAGVRVDIVVEPGGVIRITPAYTSPPAAF